MKKLSAVVCVWNEEENIKPLVKEISTALEGIDYEIIYVDDGSTDGTVKEILALQHPRLTLVQFKKNYGQSSALAAGIRQAQGELQICENCVLHCSSPEHPVEFKIDLSKI